MSSLGRSAFVVGGTSDGTAAGVPSASLWTLNLGTQQWAAADVVAANLSGDDPPGKVLGITYAIGEDAVYFVDVVTHLDLAHLLHPTTVRLRRYLPSDDTLQTVATLPTAWADPRYKHTWLVTSPTLGLLFAASTDQDCLLRQTALAVFNQDPTTQQWSYGGSMQEGYATIAPPLLWDGSLSLFRPASGDARVQRVDLPLSTMTKTEIVVVLNVQL